MLNSVCLTIPCLNEEKALRGNLPRLMEYLRTLPALRWDVVVVDNGSADGTQTVVQEAAKHYREVSLLVQPVRGRGHAIRMAWQASQATILAYMDADLAVDLSQLPDLVGPLLNGRADIVYGNRYDTRSSVTRSWSRTCLSRGYRGIARLMVGEGIQDFQCGFKAIRATCRDDLLNQVRNGQWFFDTELLVLGRARGLRVQGIPVSWVDRDETRVSFTRTIWSDLVLLIRLRRELAALPTLYARSGEKGNNPN